MLDPAITIVNNNTSKPKSLSAFRWLLSYSRCVGATPHDRIKIPPNGPTNQCVSVIKFPGSGHQHEVAVGCFGFVVSINDHPWSIFA